MDELCEGTFTLTQHHVNGHLRKKRHHEFFFFFLTNTCGSYLCNDYSVYISNGHVPEYPLL